MYRFGGGRAGDPLVLQVNNMINENRKQPELLSPAGSFEGLKAVIHAGADAVYLGGSAFGARAYAKNFDKEELLQAIDLAHLYGKKIYLTVNTLCKDDELEEVFHYLIPFYKAGLDAVLVQDLGVLRMIRRCFPDLPVHASTQMNVTGISGVQLLEKEGVARVVLARELSLSEIRRIHAASPVELESFVHGALCYCYSGRCLMSSMIGGRSGNRGRCAQPCRLPYQVQGAEKKKNREELCPISPKDMNTLEILPDILEAGVVSLKIEGRMKQPEYAAGVTSVYRKYLDLYLEKGRNGFHIEDSDKQFLVGLFSRGGSTKGYYDQYNGPSMMSFSNEKKSTIQGTLPEEKRIPIRGKAIVRCGEKASLCVEYKDISITAEGPFVQKAEKAPLTAEGIRNRIERLGGSGFEWESLSVEAGEDVFMPVGNLNALRRDALEQITREMLRPYRREGFIPDSCEEEGTPEEGQVPDTSGRTNGRNRGEICFFVSCETEKQALLLLEEEGITGLYVPEEYVPKLLSRKKRTEKLLPDIYLLFPQISRWEVKEEDIGRFRRYLEEGLSGFVVRDLEMFSALSLHCLGQYCVADSSLYSWNREAVRFLEEKGCMRLTGPLELNAAEWKKRENSSSEIPVYGYTPMMVSAQCVNKNMGSCTRDSRRLSLKDRYNAVFPVQCVCSPWKGADTTGRSACYNIIYNSIPYGLLKEHKEVLSLEGAGLRLSFTIEKPEEAVRIFRSFRDVYKFGEEPASDLQLTKGHFRRGVE